MTMTRYNFHFHHLILVRNKLYKIWVSYLTFHAAQRLLRQPRNRPVWDPPYSHSEAANFLKRILSGSYDVSTDYKHLIYFPVERWRQLIKFVKVNMYGMDNSEFQCFNVGDPRGGEGGVTDLQLVGTGEHFQSQSGHKTGSTWSNSLGMRLITSYIISIVFLESRFSVWM